MLIVADFLEDQEETLPDLSRKCFISATFTGIIIPQFKVFSRACMYP